MGFWTIYTLSGVVVFALLMRGLVELWLEIKGGY